MGETQGSAKRGNNIRHTISAPFSSSSFMEKFMKSFNSDFRVIFSVISI